MTADAARGLPDPDSSELLSMFSNRETREAYRFLLERRSDPPTMAEWIARAELVLGKANVHTSRRLRDLRDHFVVNSTKVGSAWVYELVGRVDTPVAKGGSRISPRMQAEVLSLKGRFCQMCGATPGDGAKLQIDHIIPRSWGGETNLDNLEPLCAVHNNGKRDFFASFSQHEKAIRHAIRQPTPWERIGELLRSSRDLGTRVPADLLPVVGRESHKGDPARRLRDLRVVLGWEIAVHKRKDGRVTKVEYELISDQPWPPEGPKEAVNRYERERKRRKAAARNGDL